jgi:hypothetical protein
MKAREFTQEETEALDMAKAIGELMDGHDYDVIASALSNVLVSFLCGVSDGPESALALLTRMVEEIRPAINKSFAHGRPASDVRQ